MFETIILPVIVFIALGIVTGALLALATKVFAVKKNFLVGQLISVSGIFER
jgi:Na+-translocating ferredoxin:NAD+ oxidoreductase RNF subunit RnfB